MIRIRIIIKVEKKCGNFSEKKKKNENVKEKEINENKPGEENIAKNKKIKFKGALVDDK